MAPQTTDHIQKKWMVRQLRHFTTLKTIAGVQKFQKTLLKTLEGEKDTKTRSLTAGDATFNQVIEIFGLKFSNTRWEQREETYDVPKSLNYNLTKLKMVPYDTKSEAYNRLAIDFLIVDCMWKYSNILSKQSGLPTNHPTAATAPTVEQSGLPFNNPTTATTPTVEQSGLPTNNPTAAKIAEPSYIAPTTPLMAPKRASPPLPMKVFTEMSLSVRVERDGQEWTVSGIADWALGYGDQAVLEDGAVLLAIEAKQEGHVSNAEAQLLAYLATIRQLRIQANKINVTTQGFFSDGEKYSFMCIRNNGTVMKSTQFDLRWDGDLKSVFNFLLNMLITAAESSPNTSPTKLGAEEIENFDRDIFVKVFEDEDHVPTPIIYHHETEEGEWSDIIPEEE